MLTIVEIFEKLHFLQQCSKMMTKWLMCFLVTTGLLFSDDKLIDFSEEV